MAAKPWTGIMKSLTQSLKRNGFTLPSREFQPVSGKIFRQGVLKALKPYHYYSFGAVIAWTGDRSGRTG
jgi:hypothetical protein